MNKYRFGSIFILSSLIVGSLVALSKLVDDSHQLRLTVGQDCSFVFDSDSKPTLVDDNSGQARVRTLQLSYTDAEEGGSDDHVVLLDGGTIKTDGTPFSVESGFGSVVNGLNAVTAYFTAEPGASLVLKTTYTSSVDFSDASTFTLTSNNMQSLYGINDVVDYLLPRYFCLQAIGGKVTIQGFALYCSAEERTPISLLSKKTWTGTYEYLDENYEPHSLESAVLTLDNDGTYNYINFPKYNAETLEFDWVKLYLVKFANPGYYLIENLNNCMPIEEEVFITNDLDSSNFTIKSLDELVHSFSGKLVVKATSLELSADKLEVNNVGDTITITAKVNPSDFTSKIEWTLSNDNFTQVSTTSTYNGEKMVVKSAVSGASTTVTASIDGLTKEITISTKDASDLPQFPSELIGNWKFDGGGYYLYATFSKEEIIVSDDLYNYDEYNYALSNIEEDNGSGVLTITYGDSDDFIFTYDGTTLTLVEESLSGMYLDCVGVKI